MVENTALLNQIINALKEEYTQRLVSVRSIRTKEKDTDRHPLSCAWKRDRALNPGTDFDVLKKNNVASTRGKALAVVGEIRFRVKSTLARVTNRPAAAQRRDDQH